MKTEIIKIGGIEFTENELNKIMIKYKNPVIYKYNKVFELRFGNNYGFYALENERLKLNTIKTKKELPYTNKGTYAIYEGYYLNK